MRLRAFEAGLLIAGLYGCGNGDHPPVPSDLVPSKPQGRGGSANGSAGTEGSDAGATAQGGADGGDSPSTDVITGSALVGYFYDESGIRIADEGRVVHYDWDGKKLAEWKSERPLLSAGYRDGKMIVADAGVVIGLNEQLESLFETDVVEACDDAVMVSGGHFICGPKGDVDRVYYTYDATTGKLLATSAATIYNGAPMVPIPGQDRFATVNDGSPRDYHIFEVDQEGAVTYLADSPYHGDFPCSPEVGFIGEPATHLITQEGLMLSFMGADCVQAGPGCFLKDGNLGTLPGPDAHYGGLGNERDGEVFALVDPASGVFYEAPCQEGCILQRISLATHDVLYDRATPVIRFDQDTIAQRYYLIPRPGNDGVWVIAAGRSIYETNYDDSLPYRIYLVNTPAE
jgi:hypothetical protein